MPSVAISFKPPPPAPQTWIFLLMIVQTFHNTGTNYLSGATDSKLHLKVCLCQAEIML